MTRPDSPSPPDGPQPAWTGADSYEVLAGLGVPHAAALVTRARRAHPPRPTIRTLNNPRPN
ncbi:hypothetical protein [Streptomyces uncialis]|uniref:hypothetical protein n=1 Tax=Streptomyces uncialis TaxID=1048205 RepID=UPI00386D92D3|nr:hypothetical protein OG268_37050 [Streptomyces uncialis]